MPGGPHSGPPVCFSAQGSDDSNCRSEEAAKKHLVILQKKVAGLSQSAMERFVLRARRAAGLRGNVNVLVTSNAALRILNREFRDKNKPTDVLSFPAAASQTGSRKRAPLVGEIAISAEIALQNALHLGHSPAQEVKILTLHGILHLAGFDHERDNGEMARKELKLRQALRLPVGLIERALPVHSKPRKASPATGARKRA
jgi:probable rRNA maturation factor